MITCFLKSSTLLSKLICSLTIPIRIFQSALLSFFRPPTEDLSSDRIAKKLVASKVVEEVETTLVSLLQDLELLPKTRRRRKRTNQTLTVVSMKCIRSLSVKLSKTNSNLFSSLQSMRPFTTSFRLGSAFSLSSHWSLEKSSSSGLLPFS